MDWALHDPQHGAYGSGQLRIAADGDFVTAPALGQEFSLLLVRQLADWLQALAQRHPSPEPLALIEAGPGEGSLAAQLAEALAHGWPALARRCELLLLEPNPGMAARQRLRLQHSPLPVRWLSFAELARQPRLGVLLAHEVLDALAVERIVQVAGCWRRQRVRLQGEALQLEAGEPLEAKLQPQLVTLGLLDGAGRASRPEGWCTELHPGLEPWLQQAAAGVREGWLLVIDYALEAWRYYAPSRSDGTLLAYRGQRAGADPLAWAGQADLTAHLCLDSLVAAATAAGWRECGGCRQGEALLALGLAGRLQALQRQPASQLAELLQRREALLRLVDPGCLGDFRWLALRRFNHQQAAAAASIAAAERPLFLRPPLPDGAPWNDAPSQAAEAERGGR